VTVNDTQPPAIACPANIVKEPTCPAGAKATYAPVVSDNCPGVGFVCSPASGSTFPIGTTTVTCTATDTSGNSAACSFTVRVKTPQEVIQDLINRVQALPGLTGQQSQGLVSKLNAALDAVNDNKINVACNKLNDFITQVQAYINNGTLTSGQGQPLINSAANVRNYLGCTNLPCS
jgi:HYR domain